MAFPDRTCVEQRTEARVAALSGHQRTQAFANRSLPPTRSTRSAYAAVKNKLRTTATAFCQRLSAEDSRTLMKKAARAKKVTWVQHLYRQQSLAGSEIGYSEPRGDRRTRNAAELRPSGAIQQFERKAEL